MPCFLLYVAPASVQPEVWLNNQQQMKSKQACATRKSVQMCTCIGHTDACRKHQKHGDQESPPWQCAYLSHAGVTMQLVKATTTPAQLRTKCTCDDVILPTGHVQLGAEITSPCICILFSCSKRNPTISHRWNKRQLHSCLDRCVEKTSSQLQAPHTMEVQWQPVLWIKEHLYPVHHTSLFLQMKIHICAFPELRNVSACAVACTANETKAFRMTVSKALCVLLIWMRFFFFQLEKC